MTTMRDITIGGLLILAATTVPTACNDKDCQDTFVYTDVVSVEATSPGSGTLFGSTRGLLVASSTTISEDIASVDDCLMLRYTVADNQTQPMQIDVIGYAPINNLTVSTGDNEDIAGWLDQPVSFIAAWLNGHHIIMRVSLPYDPAPRTLKVVAIGSDLYLVHSRNTPSATFSREYYIAVNLTPMLDGTSVDITLHVADAATSTTLALPFTLPPLK